MLGRNWSIKKIRNLFSILKWILASTGRPKPQSIDETDVQEEEEEVVKVEKPHKKKKPQLKKAKETKEKLKSERVKPDKSTVVTEKGIPMEQEEDK